MNQKKLLTLVASIFVIISLFIFYSKYREEKLALEQEKVRIAAEQAELDRIKSELETFVSVNNGELTKETLEDTAELYKIRIEDEYRIEPASELFIKEDNVYDEIEKIKFSNNKNELKLQIEILYYSLPKMAILIDDVGGTTSTIKYFDEINRPLNFAILPYLAKSKEANEILKSKGYTTMLHMPMEGSNKNLNEKTKGLVFTWMKDSRVLSNLKNALENIGSVDGFNNHMGSTFTSNTKKMQTVINYAKENNLYYIDSNTSRKNKGYGLAKEMGVQTTLCRHFLDNSKDIEDIKKEIKRAVEITKANQQALFIGHYHKNMAIALNESLGFIESEGVKLVYVNEILE
jgi:hypothetical protein